MDQTLENLFDKKGIIIVSPPPDSSNIEERSIDDAIEVGAEEVSPLDEDNKLIFSCDMTQLHVVKSKLDGLKYSVEESKITFVPKMKVSLNEDEMTLMSRIVAKIEEHPDVVEINDNIE